MARTRLQIAAARRADDTQRSVARELRQLREDAGLTQTAVARAAGLDHAFLSQVEAGLRVPSLRTLHALGAVLGCDVSVRLFPNTGPVIRDRFQARIVEALLRIVHRRWTAHVELPVHRPVRGVIDVVLEDRVANLLVAVEVHSELRRVEQLLRWNHQKTEALALTELATRVGARAGERPTISRLLILRSTATTRRLGSELATTFTADLPGDPGDALRALTGPDVPWAGPALLWASLAGSDARILARGTSRERPLRPIRP